MVRQRPTLSENTNSPKKSDSMRIQGVTSIAYFKEMEASTSKGKLSADTFACPKITPILGKPNGEVKQMLRKILMVISS